MELTCPSCGAKHRTEDYPGAFEILCACGYSILVPDLQAFEAPPPAPEPGFTNKAPIADEEDDAAAAIPLIPTDELGAQDPLRPIASELTPDEKLPEGMVYDPFELQQAAGGAAENAWEAAPAEVAEVNEVPADASQAKVEAAVEPAPAPAPKTPPKSVATISPAQAVLERSQRASLGQLLGRSYDVRCEGADRKALVEVAARCRKLLKGRPWLESELKRRQIELEVIPEKGGVENLPEVLAVEFFLSCTESGGRCEFRRRDEESASADTP